MVIDFFKNIVLMEKNLNPTTKFVLTTLKGSVIVKGKILKPMMHSIVP